MKLKVEVVRSPRRRKTVEATKEGNKVVVRLPATMTRSEAKRWVKEMVERIQQAEQVNRLNERKELERRARELHARYFHSRPALKSIKYVANQRDRYGSCTPDDGTIRLSHVLAEYPDWVRDYVIVHELAHLRAPDHSPYFWQLVRRYPLAERARGYLLAKGIDG
ncbi:MAG TPA: M48 family metallopeptidase [Actinomycetota bacterium]|nr:M48 family metallopeptidase [Actinomycetota bacterium]